LKHFEWEDEFYEDYYTGDSYKEIFLALEKKADSLNHLRISFDYIEGYENSLLQNILPKLYELKILVYEYYYNVISSIIENSGGRLKKILFRPYDTI
jgi:hypothetical protein